MHKKSYLDGFAYVFIATFLWGFIQVLYFKQIDYVSPFEVVCHRGIWSFVCLLCLIIITKNFKNYLLIFKDRKKVFLLSITGILVSSNWFFFILSVYLNKVQDASMGYFISPIFSVIFGYIFLNEKISKIQFASILLIIIAILNLIINSNQVPYIALSLATTWSIYGLLRKKINVSSELGLLFEQTILLPIFFTIILVMSKLENAQLFFFYNNMNSLLLMGAGVVTVIPLFFFNLGVKKIPLNLSGLIFYFVPTLQFITAILFLNEKISLLKTYSFIIIWFSVLLFIYESLKKEV